MAVAFIAPYNLSILFLFSVFSLSLSLSSCIRQMEAGMRAQGREAGIEFDYNVLAQWHPVDSQRLLAWAGQFGLQEEFMSALNVRHFELVGIHTKENTNAIFLSCETYCGLQHLHNDWFTN
jgi:hypothetical protein